MIEIKGFLSLIPIQDRYPNNLEELLSLIGKPIKDGTGKIIGKITRINVQEGCFYGEIDDKHLSISLLEGMDKISVEVKENEIN